jgi:hypothetical protein
VDEKEFKDGSFLLWSTLESMINGITKILFLGDPEHEGSVELAKGAGVMFVDIETVSKYRSK